MLGKIETDTNIIAPRIMKIKDIKVGEHFIPKNKVGLDPYIKTINIGDMPYKNECYINMLNGSTLPLEFAVDEAEVYIIEINISYTIYHDKDVLTQNRHKPKYDPMV